VLEVKAGHRQGLPTPSATDRSVELCTARLAGFTRDAVERHPLPAAGQHGGSRRDSPNRAQ
jgi:hypothetical protein